MDFEAVRAWFTKWTARRIRNCRLAGSLGLVLAPLALIFVTAGIYWALRFFKQDRLGNLGDSATCLWISLAVIPCLFIGNRLAPRRDLMEEYLEEGPDDSWFDTTSERHKVVPLVLLWILFTGPRLFDWAFRSFADGRRWAQMDLPGCAAVLWILASHSGKVSFDEIRRQLDWLDLETVLPGLKRMDGIVFLKTAPAGLSLTQDLRDQIRSESAE